MSATVTSIPVSIDKSHLITIAEHRLAVSDNGSGMDEEGLKTYFTIGSQNKRTHSFSPKFYRRRIGEFGIGKFAALAACKIFQVETQCGSYHARLLFDKEQWQQHQDWHIDTAILPYDPERRDGTTITLIDTDHFFPVHRVRRYLRERVPLQIPDFSVYINNEHLEEELFFGRAHPIDASTPFGRIHGNIVLTNSPWTTEDAGIGIYVKEVLITKETFGLETTKKLGATRLRGKVYADFLPITSSRDDIIRDSQEYVAFFGIVQKEIHKILKVAKALADKRADQRSSQALKDTLMRLGKALRKHEYLHFGNDIPLGEPIHEGDGNDAKKDVGYDVSNAQFVNPGMELSPELRQQLAQSTKTKQRRVRPSVALGKKSIIRKLRFQHVEVAVRLEHLNDNEESLLSGGIVYINTDHSLYRLYHTNDQLLVYHLARLITKELAQQAAPGVAADAFRIQSELLTDAFQHIKKL